MTLERLIADGKTPQKIVKRATIVLLSGRGLGTNAIMREARVSKPCVWRWQQAYMEAGVERLLKDKGKGPKAGKTRISDKVRLAIVTRTAKEKPATPRTGARACWPRRSASATRRCSASGRSTASSRT
jgi:transposase